MHLASPRMSSLPILPLVLLLLAHCTTQAPCKNESYWFIKEIETILNNSTSSQTPPSDLNSNDKFVLRNEDFLRSNLDEFLEAAKMLNDTGEQIRKNLEHFKTKLPNTTSAEHRLIIEKGNWEDFRKKLKEYLKALREFFSL